MFVVTVEKGQAKRRGVFDLLAMQSPLPGLRRRGRDVVVTSLAYRHGILCRTGQAAELAVSSRAQLPGGTMATRYLVLRANGPLDDTLESSNPAAWSRSRGGASELTIDIEDG